jgi:hypothetical protein
LKVSHGTCSKVNVNIARIVGINSFGRRVRWVGRNQTMASLRSVLMLGRKKKRAKREKEQQW